MRVLIWIYSWVVYPIGIIAARGMGLFYAKIRLTMRLRGGNESNGFFSETSKLEYWIHVSSQGELEYALPVIKELDSRGKALLLTYYSISAKKECDKLNFNGLKCVYPLPHDGYASTRRFVEAFKAKGGTSLLLVKYELWPGLLYWAGRNRIKTFVIDALKLTWGQKIFTGPVTALITGYESELEPTASGKFAVLGDTRVERVMERLAKSMPQLEALPSYGALSQLKRDETLVCGSMWPEDSDLMLAGLLARARRGLKLPDLIWVPHELSEQEATRVEIYMKRLGMNTVRLDDLRSLPESPVAITVLRKGVLAELYKLGTLAYVGGGFGKGIHSVWEPAIAGCFVACGPRTKRSPESHELEKHGLLRVVRFPAEFEAWLDERRSLGHVSVGEELKAVLERHMGASKRIIDYCEQARTGATP